MSDVTEPQQQPAEPSSQMAALDRLVGTWTVTGEAEGTVRYESMPGRFFLLQHVELTQYGQRPRVWKSSVTCSRSASRQVLRSGRGSMTRRATRLTMSTSWTATL